MEDIFARTLGKYRKVTFSPIVIRHCLVAAAPLLAALSVGGSTTYPTVLLHQLNSNDSSIPLDFESSTWIGSIAGFAGLPSILMPSLMQWRGRKLTLIKNQRANRILNQRNTEVSMKQLWKVVIDKAFYIPALHMILLDFMLYWSGIVVILIYSTEIIKMSTQNEQVIFFGSFIMNSVLFFGHICSLFASKYLTNKTKLLCCTFMIILCLISASAVSFIQSIGALSKDSWLCLIFLIMYCYFSGLGIASSTYPLSSSLMPIKYRGIGGALLIINTCVFHTTSLKIAPYLLLYINLWGTFLLYAMIATICLIIVWKFVPDIDGKTLQEIERFYANGVWNDGDVREHVKELQVIIHS